MDIVQKLSHELQIHVYKLHMQKHVLCEMLQNVDNYVEGICKQCCFHGFPCLVCSAVVYHGERGPGHFYNKRYLTMTSPKVVRDAMITYVLLSYQDFQVVHDIYDIFKLPQNS